MGGCWCRVRVIISSDIIIQYDYIISDCLNTFSSLVVNCFSFSLLNLVIALAGVSSGTVTFDPSTGTGDSKSVAHVWFSLCVSVATACDELSGLAALSTTIGLLGSPYEAAVWSRAIR